MKNTRAKLWYLLFSLYNFVSNVSFAYCWYNVQQDGETSLQTEKQQLFLLMIPVRWVQSNQCCLLSVFNPRPRAIFVWSPTICSRIKPSVALWEYSKSVVCFFADTGTHGLYMWSSVNKCSRPSLIQPRVVITTIRQGLIRSKKYSQRRGSCLLRKNFSHAVYRQ